MHAGSHQIPRPSCFLEVLTEGAHSVVTPKNLCRAPWGHGCGTLGQKLGQTIEEKKDNNEMQKYGKMETGEEAGEKKKNEKGVGIK